MRKSGDGGFHKIFETLFRVIQSEKPLYTRATAASTKTKAAAKLAACASVLRTTAEVGTQAIKLKTVKALIDHITQALPSVNEHFCQPLISDYPKALRSILSYAPHVEQLPKAEWLELVDFCSQGISAYTLLSDDRSSNPVGADSEEHHGIRINVPVRESPATSFTGQAKKNAGRWAKNGTNPHITGTLEELVFCIRFLFSASNAPLLEKAQVVCSTLLEFLYSSSHFGLAHQAAFTSLNCAISRVMTEDVALARWTVKKIVPLVRRHWQTRSASVREEMLISLICGRSCIPLLMDVEEVDETGQVEDCEAELQSLLNVLQLDYCKRADREYLQVDDLLFREPSGQENTQPALSSRTFSLRPEAMKSEQAWAVLDVMASIANALFNRPRTHTRNLDNSDPPQKRQKLSEPTGMFLDQLASSITPEKQGLLQILAFVVDISYLETEVVERLLKALLTYISSDVNSIANWAMLTASW